MKKFKIFLLLATVTLITSHASATEQWSSTQAYNSGHLVGWGGSTYISSHWSQGMEPEPNEINWDGWILVDENKLEEWLPSKAYNGGAIVSIGEQYYLAKWWSQNQYPENSDAWQHLKDVQISNGKDPDPGENDTITGIDKNDNGIRDDYERNVAKHYATPELRQIAISAGQEWQKLIERPVDETEVTKDEASNTFNNLISLRRCFTELRKNGGRSKICVS